MAAFRVHVTVSSILGAGYAAALWALGVEPTNAVLGAALCSVGGMLPDLDSGSGRPVRELFGAASVALPLLLLRRMNQAGMTPEGMVLLGGAVYLLVRFGGAWLFRRLTVHRGMFHSLPAALIVAEIVFLAHDSPDTLGRLTLAGGVFLGFLSHLVLDELSSVDAHGLTLRLNKAAGSALKLASRNVPATLATWVLLGVLSYAVGTEQGYLSPIHLSGAMPALRSAVKKQRLIPVSMVKLAHQESGTP
jgi:hypothetical protein